MKGDYPLGLFSHLTFVFWCFQSFGRFGDFGRFLVCLAWWLFGFGLFSSMLVFVCMLVDFVWSVWWLGAVLGPVAWGLAGLSVCLSCSVIDQLSP